MSCFEDLHEVDVCTNDECHAIESWVDGRCSVCGELDPNYDGPEDGAWPGSVESGEITHRQEQARRLKR
jgi:hypothetical protein